MRQTVGNFDAREVLDALRVANQDGQIEAEIGDVREGAAGIEGERRERGKNGFGEIAIGGGGLRLGEVRVFEDVDALFFQSGQNLLAKAILPVL